MIKDVEFAFFAQLSYLNWNEITLKEFEEYPEHREKRIVDLLVNKKVWNRIKRPNTIKPVERNGVLMYHETDKRLFGVFGIEKDKKNSKLVKPYYNFDGWQFIYSADTTKLYKDVYNLEDIGDDGFYAVAFMKDDEIVVAYRGTDGDGKLMDALEDFFADFEIGFLNRNHSQLVSAYLFIEYVKEMYPEKNINITGHSLGGCLAQYAFVCTGKKYTTVTWNALGLGKHKNRVTRGAFIKNDITRYLSRYSILMSQKLEDKVSEENGKIKNDILWINEKEYIDSMFGEIRSEIRSIHVEEKYGVLEIEIFGFPLQFKLGSSNFDRRDRIYNREVNTRRELPAEQRKEIEEKYRIELRQIYWLLKGIKNYQLSFEKDSSKIKNYYNSKDWTALLQTREGKIIDVLTGKVDKQEPTDDSKLKIVKETYDKFGFTYHGVNDFLMFMNSEGMIEAGKINSHFRKNFMKRLFTKAYETGKLKNYITEKRVLKTEERTDKEKNVGVIDTILKNLLNDKIISSSSYKSLDLKEMRYLECYISSVKENKKIDKYYFLEEFKEEDRVDRDINLEYICCIGAFNNMENLGGITGGSVQVFEIRNSKISVEKKEKKIQIPTERKILSEKDVKNQVRGGFRFNGRGIDY